MVSFEREKRKEVDEMKKIMVVLIMVIGLVVCNSEAGNYTDQGKRSKKEVLACQGKSLKGLVGKTFVAYPPKGGLGFSTTSFAPKLGVYGVNFSVKTPEKFTILSVQMEYEDHGDFYLKIKFDSGRIAYLNVGSGLFFCSLVDKEIVPELRKALVTIGDSCE